MKKFLSFILIALTLGSIVQPLLVSAATPEEEIRTRINTLSQGIEYVSAHRAALTEEEWQASRDLIVGTPQKLGLVDEIAEFMKQIDPADAGRIEQALGVIKATSANNPVQGSIDTNMSNALKVTDDIGTMLGPNRYSSSGLMAARNRAIRIVAGATPEQVNAEKNKLPSCNFSVVANFDVPCVAAYVIAWSLAVPAATISGFISSIGNSFFNILIKYTVLDFAKYGNNEAVKVGWRVARDLVNVFLIFIILYLAISIILQLSTDTKRVLTRVVAVALLVNFSAFFTGIVIDTSNIVATQFYYMAGKNTQTLPGTEANDITTQLHKGMDSTMASLNLPGNAAGKSTTEILVSMIPILLGKIALDLITAIVMFFSAIMFLTRLVVLIMLIVLSPLAFMAAILPQTQTHWNRWTSKLIEQSFFAPAFFLMFYITVKISQQGNIQAIAAAARNDSSSNVGFAYGVIYVLLVNGMMVASLLVAKSMGASGASAGMGALKKLGSFTRGALVGGATGAGVMALRNSVGRAGYNLANSESVRNMVSNNSLIGRGLKNIGEYGSKARFGGSKGSSFKEQVDTKVKLGTDYFKGNPVRQAQYMASLERGFEGRLGAGSAAQQVLYNKLSADDKIKLSQEIEKQEGEARGSMPSKNELAYDLDNLDKENQAIVSWFNSTPAVVKLTPDNAGQLQKYNSYMKARTELENRAKKAKSAAEKVEQAKSKAARPWTKVGAVLRKLQDALPAKEKEKIEKAIKDKVRDNRIKELKRKKDAGEITVDERIELAELASEKATSDASSANKKADDAGKKDDEGGDDKKKGDDKK